MAVRRDEVAVGDVVMVRPGFGLDAPIRARVTGMDEKRGQPLIDYAPANGKVGDVIGWAYLHQVDAVVEKGGAA